MRTFAFEWKRKNSKYYNYIVIAANTSLQARVLLKGIVGEETNKKANTITPGRGWRKHSKKLKKPKVLLNKIEQ